MGGAEKHECDESCGFDGDAKGVHTRFALAGARSE
jgi:hypothetical protein